MSEPYDLEALNNWIIITNQQDMSKWSQQMSKSGGGFGFFPPAGFKLTLKSRLIPGQRLRLGLVSF